MEGYFGSSPKFFIMEKEKPVCSFCGAPSENLVFGNFGCICPECASLLHKTIEENNRVVYEKEVTEIPKPTEMKAYLDQYVIGQDEAKERICVAVYNHYKRLYSKTMIDDVDIEKSNVIMVGPTGTGKCVTEDNVVTVRNKKTGCVENIKIKDFVAKYLK